MFDCTTRNEKMEKLKIVRLQNMEQKIKLNQEI